ncbi:hypothetical protein MAP00_006067 [Monascus purpureus]|nr:hypothetical protein MAP00_006067 [Monascus purpureus]
MGFVVASLWISLFLSTLETTITVTALHHISDDLNGLGQSIWIVVADLLTYDGDEFRLSSYIGEMDYAAVTEHS